MVGRPLEAVLVGLGRIGAGYASDPLMSQYFDFATHAQVLAAHPAFHLAAAVDPSEEARRRFRQCWHAPMLVAAAADLPKDFSPDVVVLATPPAGRLEVLERFPSPKVVVVEKPLGLALTEASAFVERCRQRHVLVQVNLVRRADESLRHLAGGGLDAQIGSVQAAFGLYGNGLRNNGTHMIDLVRLLLGEIETVAALGPARPLGGAPLSDDVQLPFAMTLVNGVVVTMQPLAFAHYRENALDVWGARGRLAIMQEGLSTMVYPRVPSRAVSGEHEIASDRPALLPCTLGRALYRLYDNVADAVGSDAALWSPGESALQTERVIDAVLESARRNCDLIQVAAPAIH